MMQKCLKIVNKYRKDFKSFDAEELLAGAKGVPHYVTAYAEEVKQHLVVVTIVSKWTASPNNLPSNMSYIDMDI